jgi:hypothetical protein
LNKSDRAKAVELRKVWMKLNEGEYAKIVVQCSKKT